MGEVRDPAAKRAVLARGGRFPIMAKAGLLRPTVGRFADELRKTAHETGPRVIAVGGKRSTRRVAGAGFWRVLILLDSPVVEMQRGRVNANFALSGARSTPSPPSSPSPTQRFAPPIRQSGSSNVLAT